MHVHMKILQNHCDISTLTSSAQSVWSCSERVTLFHYPVQSITSSSLAPSKSTCTVEQTNQRSAQWHLIVQSVSDGGVFLYFCNIQSCLQCTVHITCTVHCNNLEYYKNTKIHHHSDTLCTIRCHWADLWFVCSTVHVLLEGASDRVAWCDQLSAYTLDVAWSSSESCRESKGHWVHSATYCKYCSTTCTWQNGIFRSSSFMSQLILWTTHKTTSHQHALYHRII